jgi:hypothetical protein
MLNRYLDQLEAALGQQASCQDTMDHLCFGNGETQGYETIGGGFDKQV